MSEDLQREFDELVVHWEGPDGAGIFDLYFNPGINGASSGGLRALYLTEKSVKWTDALTYCGLLDASTPLELKGPGYYALLAAVFCYSARPASVIYVPKGYEKLADYFLEDKENRRRCFREAELVGILKDRKMLKSAIGFLVNKGVLEEIGVGEFAVKRRPIARLKFT